MIGKQKTKKEKRMNKEHNYNYDDVLSDVPTLQEILSSPITMKAVSKDKAKKAAYYQRPDVKAKQAAYYQRNADIIKAKQAAYYQRPDVKAKQAAYYQRPDVKAKQAAYRQRNADIIKAKQAAYRQRNADIIKAKQAASSLKGLRIEEQQKIICKKYCIGDE